MTNFIKANKVESAVNALSRAENFFSSGKFYDGGLEEMETQEAEKLSINLLCPITMIPIKVPARGDLCSHLQCFELDTYI